MLILLEENWNSHHLSNVPLAFNLMCARDCYLFLFMFLWVFQSSNYLELLEGWGPARDGGQRAPEPLRALDSEYLDVLSENL